MTAFRLHRFGELDLTVVRAEGVLDCEDIASIIRAFYSETGERPSTLALWDLRQARLERIQDWEAAWISQVAEHTLRDRENGKTAIVVSNDVDYGISRMILSWCFCLPVAMATFHTVEEAALWLQADESDICGLVERISRGQPSDKNKDKDRR